MEKYKNNIPTTSQLAIIMYTSIHAQCYTSARFVYNSKQQPQQQQRSTTSPHYIKDNATAVIQAMQL